jgi:hypothetical protein
VDRELLRGAAANGHETDLWSLPRVAALINEVTGVSCHPAHVWRILYKLGWSLQRPTLRARERDEDKVLEWRKETWGEVKNIQQAARLGWFFSMKAAFLRSHPSDGHGRLLAYPVLRHSFNRKMLSICSTIAYRWDSRRGRLLFQIVPDSFTDEKLITFLSHLRKVFRWKKLILIWDGLPSHRSRRMQQYLRQQRRWLTVVRLPPYAPDLNPVEFIWGNIQATELANRCIDDLGGMVQGAKQWFSRIHANRSLSYSFLNHAGISFRHKVR